MIIYMNPPTKCDVCKGIIGNDLYDIKTTMGPWACTCEGCFYRYGMGLGTGLGQKYVKDDIGRYVKVEG